LTAHASVLDEIVSSSAMALTAVLIAVVLAAMRNSARHEVTSAPHGCGGDTKVAAGWSCSWCRAPCYKAPSARTACSVSTGAR
jgi:hypothetical protein